MSTFDEVLNEAGHLSPPDRVRLVQAIWDTVSPEDWPRPSAAWVAEAQRRSAEFDAGLTSASAWTEVLARAREKAGLDE